MSDLGLALGGHNSLRLRLDFDRVVGLAGTDDPLQELLVVVVQLDAFLMHAGIEHEARLLEIS